LIGLFATAALAIAVRRGSLFVDKTMLLLGVAIATGLTASLASDAPLMSIFGGLTRSSGVVSMVVWFVAFWAGLQFKGDTTDRDRQLVLFGRASAVFALLVVLGRLGIPIVPSPDSARATGPLGSSAFSGALLALMTPIGVMRMFAQNARLRYEGVVSLALTVAALAACGARASWLGATLGVVISLSIAFKQKRAANTSLVDLRRFVVGLVLVLLVGISALFAFGTASRVTTTGETNGTAAGRTVLWATGLRAVVHDPLFGVGFDQQEFALAENLPSDFERRFDDSVIPDRAHNWVLDLWLGGGLLTVVAMVGALVVALRRVQRDPLGIAVLAGVTGYLAQAQFNFSLPGVEALMWLLLGVAASPHRRSVKLAIQPVIPTAIVGLMVAAPFVLNIAADTQLERGRRSEQSGDLVKARELFQSASSLASWQPTLEEVIARFGMRIGDNELAQSASVVASSRSGGQLRWRELQGEALLASGEFADARDWYQSLIEESADDSSLFVGLGRAQLGLADTGWALVAFNTALQINPNSEKAQLGLEQLSNG
jgi:O-antigen ligase